jgi:hypothetical protein
MPVRREVFADERGHVIQLTWHPDSGIIVASIWHQETCLGTVRLPAADATRLGSFAMAVLTDWARGVPEGPPSDVEQPPGP